MVAAGAGEDQVVTAGVGEDQEVAAGVGGDLSVILPSQDRRGRHEPANKKDLQLIHAHIESFKPCAPHYRREHAPNR